MAIVPEKREFYEKLQQEVLGWGDGWSASIHLQSLYYLCATLPPCFAYPDGQLRVVKITVKDRATGRICLNDQGDLEDWLHVSGLWGAFMKDKKYFIALARSTGSIFMHNETHDHEYDWNRYTPHHDRLQKEIAYWATSQDFLINELSLRVRGHIFHRIPYVEGVARYVHGDQLVAYTPLSEIKEIPLE